MTRAIPEGAVEVQDGLFAVLDSFEILGNTFSHYDLYSGDGYCFWEVNQYENYTENYELKPLNERVFATFARTVYKTIKDINDNYKSVKIENGYNIIN